ncbi:nucleoside triphosphate pyrophosphohydrolase [Collinsella sp. AGMB00827]|uniref:Nucleoside triphosphate pyrophosphohydrolase n=1 Tax=Collinsella ureilytica TaxID=2869515 RepID=A0ABS7MJM0_9ACTN|nr:nucleoside triphosphate pyrophosphohydrolase [Collinsella urealyticum]MBY4797564.1 nucleoside triphosphate pyrophosphohydrolase [Collinsella urealyticum]
MGEQIDHGTESLVSLMEAGMSAEPSEVGEAFQELVNIIWRLRQPDGCPWDRAQTHTSITKNMIEEAYEAVACIEDGDTDHLREELGDVLMQVLLHAQIASDAHEFSCADVIRTLSEKLVRRHPHVFGDVEAHDAQEALHSWEQAKLKERVSEKIKTPSGLLDDVPRALPALMQAQKVSRKAASAGFEWDSVDAVWAQVAEEHAEFDRERPGSASREMEFGDLLFSLVNVARMEGIDAESALRASTAKFRERWSAMEAEAARDGRALEDLSSAEQNELWDYVKRAEA